MINTFDRLFNYGLSWQRQYENPVSTFWQWNKQTKSYSSTESLQKCTCSPQPRLLSSKISLIWWSLMHRVSKHQYPATVLGSKLSEEMKFKQKHPGFSTYHEHSQILADLRVCPQSSNVERGRPKLVWCVLASPYLLLVDLEHRSHRWKDWKDALSQAHHLRAGQRAAGTHSRPLGHLGRPDSEPRSPRRDPELCLPLQEGELRGTGKGSVVAIIIPGGGMHALARAKRNQS